MKIRKYEILEIVAFFRCWVYGVILAWATIPIMFTGIGIATVILGGLLVVALDSAFIAPLIEDKINKVKQGE